jgi:aspartate 1-decarboxylase
MSYADGYNRVRKGDTFNHDSTINNPVLQMAQQPGKNNITEGLSIVVANFSQGQHFFRNTVFFTSASDHDDVTKAVPFATQISQKGPLIIIAYSENVNIDELKRLNPAKIIQINPKILPNQFHNFKIS